MKVDIPLNKETKPNHSLPLVECDTWSIFKQSETGFDSVFLLSEWLPKKPSLPYYLPIVGGEEMDSCLFQKH